MLMNKTRVEGGEKQLQFMCRINNLECVYIGACDDRLYKHRVQTNIRDGFAYHLYYIRPDAKGFSLFRHRKLMIHEMGSRHYVVSHGKKLYIDALMEDKSIS